MAVVVVTLPVVLSLESRLLNPLSPGFPFCLHRFIPEMWVVPFGGGSGGCGGDPLLVVLTLEKRANFLTSIRIGSRQKIRS